MDSSTIEKQLPNQLRITTFVIRVYVDLSESLGAVTAAGANIQPLHFSMLCVCLIQQWLSQTLHGLTEHLQSLVDVIVAVSG